MDTAFKRPQRRATIELWRIWVPVVGALCFALLALGRVPPRDTHETILTSLRAIDVNHASLQRDVLQARAGLLKNYAPLAESIQNLRVTVGRLRATFAKSGVENTDQLEAELAKLSSSIDRDEKLIERFRAANGVLQNSLSFANEMLTELHETGDPRVKYALSQADDLGSLMLRFAADPREELAALIEQRLQSLSNASSSAGNDIRAYAEHTRLVLRTLPVVDAIVDAILASHTSAEAQMLQKYYLDAFGVISVRSAWSRILLGSIAVLLCINIGILVYRLREQTQRLAHQLDLENLTTAIKRRFDDEQDATIAVNDALHMVADYFDAEFHALVIVDGTTLEATESFGNLDSAKLVQNVRGLYPQIITAMVDNSVKWTRFHYQNLQKSAAQSLPEGAMSAGAIVVASIVPSVFEVLYLEHADVRKKPGSDEIRLLGSALIAITQSLNEQRNRVRRQELETRLDHSQRLEAVGTLAGGIAHEFNNALGAIMGYGEMALQLNRRKSRTRQYLGEILSSAHRAKHVIDQILTFSRKRERISRPFDVRQTIEDIIPLVKLSIADDVQLIAELPDGLPAIVGNPLELQQIIMNLSINAAQASSAGSAILIKAAHNSFGESKALSHTLRPPGNYVAISVSDTGSGIAPSIMPHIFEPFFTSRSKLGGTGLGLATVHGLVTAMAGRIDVTSTVGRGSTFTLFLPGSSQAPIPLSAFFDESNVPLGNGEVVAIGQKDHDLRLMYEEKIAALGYEPVGFGNIAALKKWLATVDRAPELLLLDLDLWQQVSDLREVASEFSSTPTLFMTDPERGELDHRALAEFSVLRKPVGTQSLARALARLVVERRPV